jgi:acyl-CoA synthetase (AMP-forming)/AMP-acid ligase II
VIAPDLLRNPARRFGDRPCMVGEGRSLTFAECDRRADQLAAALAARGVVAGDRVALLALNEVEYLEIQVAAQRLGAILVPLNYRLAVAELAFIAGDAGARLLIHGPGQAEPARALGLPTLHLGPEGVGESYEQLLADHPDPERRGPLEVGAAACILYTSGTTGRPKGAVLSNLALYARAAAHGVELPIAPGEVFVQTLPMFHIASNLSYGFTYCGATNVLVKAFDAEAVTDTIARHAATHVLLVPTTINMLCNHPVASTADFSSLRTVLYGASPIAPEVLRRAIEVFGCGFVQFFGMTETSGCTLLRAADHDPVRFPERLASAGTDTVSFETRVVDAADRELPPGEVGEIVTRGPAVMTGYWNQPEASAEALRNGWMHTGDLGYRAADGYLYVTDRLKDMIVSGAENVYPREVEDVLFEHPDVLDAAVIGVPDERWGERVHAVVCLRPGRSLGAAALQAFCRERLASYKCPRSVAFVEELPRNVTGKVLKRELRAAHWPVDGRSIG